MDNTEDTLKHRFQSLIDKDLANDMRTFLDSKKFNNIKKMDLKSKTFDILLPFMRELDETTTLVDRKQIF